MWETPVPQPKATSLLGTFLPWLCQAAKTLRDEGEPSVAAPAAAALFVANQGAGGFAGRSRTPACERCGPATAVCGVRCFGAWRPQMHTHISI